MRLPANHQEVFMFRFRSIATGVVALGLTAVVPAFARADQFRHDDRDDHRLAARVEQADRFRYDHDHDRDWDHGHDWDHHDRDDHVRIEIGARPIYVNPAPVFVSPNVDRNVALCDVPACVLDTANRSRQGPIESVQYVFRDGREFYRFIVDSYGHNLDMRVGLDGRLLSIEPC